MQGLIFRFHIEYGGPLSQTYLAVPQVAVFVGCAGWCVSLASGYLTIVREPLMPSPARRNDGRRGGGAALQVPGRKVTVLSRKDEPIGGASGSKNGRDDASNDASNGKAAGSDEGNKPTLSVDVLEKRADSLLAEYEDSGDVNEAVECATEMGYVVTVCLSVC